MTRCLSPRDLFPDQLTDELRAHFAPVPRTARPKRLTAATSVLRLISSQLDEDTFTLFLHAAVKAADEAAPATGSQAIRLNASVFTTRAGVLLRDLDPEQEEVKVSWHLLLAMAHFLHTDEVAPVLRCARSAWRECLVMAKESADRAAAATAAWVAPVPAC